MSAEPIIFQGPEGEPTVGEGDVERFSTAGRITIATLWVVGGLLGGTACIIVPGVHLITTWAFPLLGIMMAMRTMRREVVIQQPQGLCPSCNQRLNLPGGATSDPGWQKCPSCHDALKIRPQTATAPIDASSKTTN